MVTVTIDGRDYPCRPTMGAMLRYKRETGREVTSLDGTSVTDLCTYLWCCVASACKHDGVEFDMSLMDFADSLTNEDLVAWAQAIGGEPASEGDDEKKSR